LIHPIDVNDAPWTEMMDEANAKRTMRRRKGEMIGILIIGIVIDIVAD